MIRPSPSRRPGAYRALAFSLAVAAVAFGLAPTAPTDVADSFEAPFPGSWTVFPPISSGNAITSIAPAADGPATKAVGAWDGTKALRVQFTGNPANKVAEIVQALPVPVTEVSLRLMVYVPFSTFVAMPPGEEVQIARLMPSSTDSASQLSLYLVRSSNALFVRGDYAAILPVQVGGSSTTDIAPDTWHAVDLTYQLNGATADLTLCVDDLSAPRATAPNLTSLLSSPVGAVAVGLTGDVTGTTTAPLVWWIDDVKVSPARTALSAPLVHLQQDGFETPNVAVSGDPAGKSLVAVTTGEVKQFSYVGHRDGGLYTNDTTTASAVSAAYGELTGADGGQGMLYHRVWWRQGQSTNANATNHALAAIGSSAFGSTGTPLAQPMAAVSVAGGGGIVLWGWSAPGLRDPDLIAPGTLDAGWHLVELAVTAAGTGSGLRRAWIDGRPLGPAPANWTGIQPSQWQDGHLYDPANSSYVGEDDYDDSRTSQAMQASQFGLLVGPMDAGSCAALVVVPYDSSGGVSPPAEDTLVLYDAHGGGAFYVDPGCTSVGPFASPILVPSGVTNASVYFLPAVPGPVTVTLGAPDFLSRDTTFQVGGGGTTGDTEPPSAPGPATPAQLVTNAPVLVTWPGSHDDGGSGLLKYVVETSQNDGGWTVFTSIGAGIPDADAGFIFDGGEAYWRLRVRAEDQASNISAPGSESPLLTMDLTPPLPPASAPAATVSAGLATATWPAAVDRGAVTSGIRSYVLHVTTLPGGAATDYGGPATSASFPVSAGHTYTMTVHSSDGAGNASVESQVGAVSVLGAVTGLRLLGLGSGPDASFAVVGDDNAVSVEAIDGQGNVVPTYNGTVAFSALDGAGNPYPATLPLDGGSYAFVPADLGRHAFKPGFTFNAVGDVVAGVADLSSAALRHDVRVTVIARGDVRIVEDANPWAAPGVPYLVNASGALHAVSSDPAVRFSTCDSPPQGLILDPVSGALRWIPADDTSFPLVLCATAQASTGGATDTYRWTVQERPASSVPPVASFTVTPDSTDAGSPSQFDSTGSVVDTALGPPAYRYRFGDGSPLGFRSKPLHTYLLPGGYQPALTLFDAIGRSDQTKRPVRIQDRAGNDPPSVTILTAPPTAAESLDTALFATAADGSSPAGTIHWDLGNAVFEEGADAGARYGPGRYWATAMAVDGNGLAATDKLEVAVTKEGEVPPFCVAQVDPPLAIVSPSTGRADVAWIGWRSPGSNPIASVGWTIDGVGSSADTVNSRYSTGGWHRGRLTVTDTQGLTCTDQVAVLVQGSAAGSPLLPPRILDPGVNGTIDCAKASYDGRPALASGTGPFRWSINATLPLAVDADGGQVSWTPPLILPKVTSVSYTLQVQGAGGTDTLAVDVPYTCKQDASLGTRCGCGAGTGAPAAAGLLLLWAWTAARRKARLSASRRPASPPR